MADNSASGGQISLDLILNSKDFQSRLNSTVNNAVKSANTGISNVSSAVKKLGVAIAAAFSVKELVTFSKECLSLGSDLAEVQNVVDVTFSTLSQEIDDFASTAASQFGLSETMAKQYAGTYGSMAEAFGFTERQAATMAETLTGLTGDVASFYNISQDEAYTKLKSVFSGETESLKDLGIVMTQSALDAYALANGYGKTTSAMTEAEKTALRYAFVQDQLTNAAGDFARTSDGWANSTRTLALQFDSLKAELGQGLINVLSPIVQWLNTIIAKLTEAAKKFNEFTAAIMGKTAEDAAASATAASTEALNESLETTEDTAESASEAMRELMGFDEINKLSDNSAAASDSSSDTSGLVDEISALGDGIPASIDVDTSPAAAALDALKASLEQVKTLWQTLWKQFRKSLTMRFDAGNVKEKLEEIWGNLQCIGSALQDICTNADVAGSAKYMLEQIAAYCGAYVGNMLSVGVSLAAALTAGIAQFLDEKKDFLQGKIASIFETTGDIFGDLTGIMNDVTDIINHILQLPETAQIIADAINIVITPFLTIMDLLLKFVKDNLDGLAKVLTDNAEGLQSMGEDVIRFFANITGTISDFVEHLCAKWEEVYDGYIRPAIEKIWDGIDRFVSFLIGKWQQYIAPFLEEFAAGFRSLVQKHIQPMADKIITFFGKVADTVAWLWTDILEPLVEKIVTYLMPAIKLALRQAWNVISTVFAAIADVIGGLIDVASGIIDFIKGVFTGDWELAWEGIKEIFSGIWEAVAGIFGNFLEGLQNALAIVADYFADKWNAICEIFAPAIAFFQNIWNAIQESFSNVGDWFQEKFQQAADGIQSAWSGVTGFFSNLWNSIKKTFSKVGSWFKTQFQQGVNHVKAVWAVITKFFSDIWESIKQVFSKVGAWFKEQFQKSVDNIKAVWSVVTGFFSGVWNGIIGVFSNIKSAFKEKFSAAVDGIKEAFSGIKTWFSSIWDGFTDILKTPINGLIDIVNWFIDKINGFQIDLPDWAVWAMDKVFGVEIQSLGFNLDHIDHLAQGGYVAANTPRLAVVGDNRREGEIIAPESKITEAVEAALANLLAQCSNKQQSDTMQANIYLGNELLSQQLIKMQQIRNYRSGGLA